MPDHAREWLADRRSRMADGLDRLAQAARTGAIPSGAIRDGGLNIERLAADPLHDESDSGDEEQSRDDDNEQHTSK